VSRPAVRALAALIVGLRLLAPLGVAAGEPPVAEASPAPADEAVETALTVHLEGVDGDLEDNVRSLLSIEDFSDKENLPDPWVERLHRKAPEEIALALQPFGFYRPQIDSELRREGDAWVATYRIDPGDPVHLASVELKVTGEGAETEVFAEIPTRFPLAAGDVLMHEKYESGKRLFTSAAERWGYFDAAFTHHQVEVDLASYSASIHIDFDTGRRYRFGDVTFDHDDLLRPAILESRLKFESGEPFDRLKLQETQLALTDTAYFNQVEISARSTDASDDEIPILISLVPAKKGLYNLGVGYGTDTGFRTRIGWTLRRLNRRGHSATTWIRYSQRDTSFVARYRVPQPFGRIERSDFTLGYGEKDTDTYTTLRGWLGGASTRLLGRWRLVSGLNVQTDDFTIGPDVGDTFLLIGGLSSEFVNTDDRIYPDGGIRVRFEVRGAAESLASDNTFLQFKGGVKGVLTLGEESPIGRRHRLLSRFDVGWLATGEFRELPPGIRFLTGGDQTIRGFGYQTVGGTDEFGEVIGGDSLVVSSVEYEYRVTDTLSGALFVDAGNAAQELSEELAIGAGFGVRLRTPIGPVRLDLAWAVSHPENPVRLHLSIGPDL